jgi:hypothetical protein
VTTGLNGCNGSTCPSSSNPFVLNPGVYCGGVTIGANSYVEFMPGTYVINGGQLYIGNSTTTWNATTGGDGTGGVMFYLTDYGTETGKYEGFKFGDSNNVSIDLTAPTSGTYTGILIFQDPGAISSENYGNQATASTMDAAGTFTLAGAIYLPTTGLVLTGQPTASKITAVDVYDLELNGSSSLTLAASTGSSSSTAGSIAMVQ